jgi:uncharacterized protein DUF3631
VARPELPDELDDRAWDYWEPLLAIADLAGEDWPERARAAAVELSSGEAREGDSLSLRLLADVRDVFASAEAERFRTPELIAELCKIEESPWGDWNNGKPITPQALSKLLRPYRIRTRSVWVDGAKARGYQLEQFADAWGRYLAGGVGGRGGRGGRSEYPSEAAPTTPTAPTTQDTGENSRFCSACESPEVCAREHTCREVARMAAETAEADEILGELDW